jgi:Mn-dependent DtxR family transcriptional regulator
MEELHQSGEDYLEAILMLREKNGAARAVDVARKLGVTRPSVSHALTLLKEQGYIQIEKSSFLKFTPKGEEKAKEVYGRHQHLTDFLVLTSGVSPERAEENACRIEHIIDEDVYEGILRFMEKNP